MKRVETGLRYGVDGYPYILGLGAGSALAGLGGAALVRAGRRLGWVLVGAAVLAAVTNALGLRYVLGGKLALRDLIMSQVRWRGDETVADFGAGGGLLGIGAAGHTTGTIICVDLFVGKDLSGNEPDRLRRNADRAGVGGRLEIRREDVRATTLADASVDVIVSTLCVHNIGDRGGREAAVREMVRVLRPGGTIVISDLAHVDQEYAPLLRDAGLEVSRPRWVLGSFPPQRLLTARST